MIVFLAEKEMVAVSIAKALKIPIQKGNGYYANEHTFITWSYGHLVSLDSHESYGYNDWNLNNLPIIPNQFNLKIIQESYIKKQFKVIKELFLKASEIIVATDAGREGELIYRYIASLIGEQHLNASIKRLWISDHTEKSIHQGIRDLKPIEDYDPIYLAAKARSESDWVVGVNFTQCISLLANKKKVISIGRVQTATLRIIVDRYIENIKHEEVFYYVPVIKVITENEEIELSSTEKFDSENNAKNIKFNNAEVVLQESKKEIKEKPPLLFNLTQLQRIANRKYQFTADKTLEIAQSLYEKHKVLSYPRTESQYLPENQQGEIKDILNELANKFAPEFDGVVPQALKNVSGNSIFDDTKLTDHYAIIPTTSIADLQKLTDEESIIYKLVVQQFIQCFHNNCIKEKQTISTQKAQITFSKTITVTKEPGWKTIEFEEKKYKHQPVDNSLNEENKIIEGTEEQRFFQIQNEEKAMIKGLKIEKKKTRPKPLFTDDTLLESMMNAGKFLEDTELKKAIKITGIGTSATRADTIKKLIKRGYIQRKKNKFIPLQLGVELIAVLKKLPIASVKMTAIYEAKLNLIEVGKLDYDTFMNETRDYVKEVLPEIQKAGEILGKITLKEDEKKILGNCPSCNSGKMSLNRANFYSCSNYKSDPPCKFSVQGIIAKKKITPTHIKSLLSPKKETSTINGFTSSKNKKFSGILILNEDLKVQFKPYEKK